MPASCDAHVSSHYAFLSPHTHGSTVMRAHLASVVVGMTGAFHNASGSFIRLHNVSAREERHDAEDHFKRHAHRTPLAACIFVKEVPSEDGAIRSCRRRGALVLLDCVDSPICFDEDELDQLHGAGRFDGLLAQTEEHTRWLMSMGYAAASLPHPHGDAAGWAAERQMSVRSRVRGVGLVVADPKNMPPREEVRALAAACCRANATLFLVLAPNDLGRREFSLLPQGCGGVVAGQCGRHALRCRDAPGASWGADVPEAALRPLPSRAATSQRGRDGEKARRAFDAQARFYRVPAALSEARPRPEPDPRPRC
jgi:hypothetical protein